MVESNEAQPQDKLMTAEDANEEITQAIELLNCKFKKVDKSIDEKIEDLTVFKATASKKILDLIKEGEEFKELFSSFAT
jgi:hypothetical protein